MIRCVFDKMQNLLALISSILQSFLNALKGGDRWFLVIDEVIVDQENLANLHKQLEQRQDGFVRRDTFNRRYEALCSLSSGRLTISEIWSSLGPISLFKFLRYALSDFV